MKSLKQYFNLYKGAIEKAVIKLENMFVIVKESNTKALDKKVIEEAVRTNKPICVSKFEADKNNSFSINPNEIFFPDLFLKKRDRIKKLFLQVQNA